MLDISQYKVKIQQLKTDTYALYLAGRHPLTPWYAKILVVVIVGYALSPIDLIPDFIPVLGYLDDLILLPLGLSLAIRLIPPAVMDECRSMAQTYFKEAKPISRWAALVIILIWAGLAWLLASWAYRLLIA